MDSVDLKAQGIINKIGTKWYGKGKDKIVPIEFSSSELCLIQAYVASVLYKNETMTVLAEKS